MLAARVKVLHEYVAGVEAGRLPLNHALLRQIAAFLSQLPAADTVRFFSYALPALLCRAHAISSATLSASL